MTAQLNDIAQIWWQWMAGMFWQVSLFILLVTLLDMAIRRWAWPQVRYVLWGLVFLKLIIPPTWQMPTSIISWIQPRIEKQIPLQIEPRKIITVNPQATASSMSSPTRVRPPVVTNEKASWQAIVLLTWLAGMIAFALMLIIKMSRLPKRSKTQGDQNIPEWFHNLLAKTAQRLNLKKIPAVVFFKDMKSPAIYGIFKPILLLPERCLNHLSQEQAEHILIHELCHLKRGDLLVHWFCLILQVVYWFNPLLIWTRRQMRHVCEICCDISVANLLRERTKDYRDTLLATARELLAETVEPGLGLLGVFEEPFRLVSRLKWLEKKTWENRKRRIAATICTSLIMVVCVMPMAGLSQQEDSGQPDYKLGIEYDQENGPVTITYPAVFYEAFFVEVDEDKDLDLDAAEYLGGLPPEQIAEAHRNQSTSSDINIKGLSIDYSAWSAFRFFKDDIKIGGRSFPDIESALKALKYRSAVIRNILVPADKISTIKIQAPTGDREFILEINAQVLENWLINQNFDLTAYKPSEEPNASIGLRYKGIETENGSTMVITCPAVKNAITERGPAIWTKLYIFLTARVIQTSEDARKFIQTNGKELSTDFIYTDLNPTDDIPPISNQANPEYKAGVEYDHAAGLSQSAAQNKVITTTINRAAKVRIDSDYDLFFKELNLSSDTLERLKEIMLDEEEASVKATMVPGSVNMIAVAKAIDPGDEFRQKINELLGDEEYARYQTFKDRIWEVRSVTDFNKSLSSDDMLAEDQQRALIDAMYDKRKKIVSEQDNEKDRDVPITEEFADNLKGLERMHEGYIETANGILNKTQLEKLKTYYKKELDEQESNMRMMISRMNLKPTTQESDENRSK